MGRRIIIRADASTRIGSGHVMRCLTLAEELSDAGAEVSFISRGHPGNLNELIREKGFCCQELPKAPDVEPNEQRVQDTRFEYASLMGVSQQQDAQETIESIGTTRADWLIVDHYGIDEDWETRLRPYAAKIMVIDDLADRRHDCDLLLDQNFFIAGEKRYDELVSPACTKLLGPKYALLRREFREAKKNLRERSGEVKRVLVFLGGTDPENITGTVIEALSDPELIHLKVDVVIGSQNPHRVKVEKLVHARPKTTLHIQVSNIAKLMSNADAAIGAGGSTAIERLSLGLPCIVIPIAKNQEEISKQLEEKKYIILIDNKQIRNGVKKGFKYLGQAQKNLNATNIFQGNGAEEIANLLVKGPNPLELFLRRAESNDCLLYWHWVNDVEVRSSAFDSNIIELENHKKWFDKKIKDNESMLFLLDSKIGAIGQIRFEKKSNYFQVDYSISRQFRGYSLGSIIVKKGIETIKPGATILAEVKETNKRSAAIFSKSGFSKKEQNKKYIFTKEV